MFRCGARHNDLPGQTPEPFDRASFAFPAAVLAAALTLGAFAQEARSQGNNEEIPFDEADIFFELNNTDGDLGIHGKIDGGPWTNIEIKDPSGHRLMEIRAKGDMKDQAVTELFFESAEPRFEDLDPADFFARFAEGTYQVTGVSEDGESMESETEVTHVMPAPPVPTVNDEPMAEVCDDEDPDYDAPEVKAPVTIEWDEVTSSHPELGADPVVDVTIHNYEVVVEVELEVAGEEFASVFSVFLPPDVRSMTVPEEFIDLGDTFKYEVLAREESFNQTAVESCFELK